MTRFSFRTATAILALSLSVPALQARASEPLDQSNSASAVGSPSVWEGRTTRGTVTAIPANRSSSPTDAAYAFRTPVEQTTMMAGVPNVNWSNSASATGSPSTFTGPTYGSMLAEARGGQ